MSIYNFKHLFQNSEDQYPYTSTIGGLQLVGTYSRTRYDHFRPYFIYTTFRGTRDKPCIQSVMAEIIHFAI
jgi:hypothetical protein